MVAAWSGGSASRNHAAESRTVASAMNLAMILVPIVLIIPLLYLLFTRKSEGGSGGDRSDEKEPRRELTGTEQHKHREQP